MIYWQLFASFFYIGLFSFGGGYASMPLIIEQAISTHHWIDMGTFTNLFTISQMTPGPIAINGSTFVGMRVAGLSGAIIATIGCVLPSCIIVTILAIIYNKYKDIDWLKGILSYLRPAVIAMIAISGLTLLGDAVHFGHNTSCFALVVFIVSFVLLVKYKVNPIIIMVACGILEVIINML